MTGVYERALGDEADRLHPRVRDRYGLGPEDDYATVGTGHMDIVRGALALPVLYAMPARNMLFPETGTDVPFTVTTVGWRDAAGHEVLTTRREFDFEGASRRFDSLTLWDTEGERLLDFLGTGGHVVSELDVAVEDGALLVRSGRQWLRATDRYVPVPGPLAVDVEVRDRYDEDAGRFRVTGSVTSGVAGHVLSYRGTFTQERRAVAEVPPELRPVDGVATLPPR